MQRWLLVTSVAALVLVNSGCFINIYSSNPNRRMNQLMNVSEGYRQIEDEWERIWFVDQPSHLTNERVNGGME